jgi:hypothetical protein
VPIKQNNTDRWNGNVKRSTALVAAMIPAVLCPFLLKLGASLPVAIAISSTMVFIAGYLVGRPTVSFSRGAITLLSFVGGVFFAFEIPPLLRPHITIQLAYALPSFFASLICYFALPKRNGRFVRTSFWKWAVGSLILGAVVAGAVTFVWRPT